MIFDIKRFAVHDGPGIRTTIFFKGCPLSCEWCHNPESRSSDPQLSVKHLAMDGKLFEQEEVTGKEMTVDELLYEVERDRIFFEESGGGVTLSGGEPLHQPDFCAALLKTLKENELRTALDTTGYTSAEEIARVSPYTDLFLFDLKIMDDTEHLKYTGISNKIILDNLKILLEDGKQIIIRFPVIPGITDTIINIQSIIDLLKPYHQITRSPQNISPQHHGTTATLNSSPQHHLTTSPLEVHLLPYHTTAKNKYHRFQMEHKMYSIVEINKKRLTEIKTLFERSGFQVKTRG